MKFWFILGIVSISIFFIGCGNQTVRSIEIYVHQSDYDAARRTAMNDLPTMPDGKAKAEVYSWMARITANEIDKLNSESRKEIDNQKQIELFDRKIQKILQINEEIQKSITMDKSFVGLLDTLKQNLWIIFFNAGVTPFNEKKWDIAVREYSLAWTLDSTKSEAGKLIGECYLQQNKGILAENWIKRTISMENKNTPDYGSRYNLANYYFSEEKWEQAVQIYAELLALPAPDPSDTNKLKSYQRYRNQSYANKAIALDQLNKSTEATKAYEEALKEQPDNDILWFNFGKRHFESERYKDSEKAIQNVLRINPQDIDAKYLLALVKFQIEEYPEAERLLMEVVKEKPDLKSAWVNLAGAIGNQMVAVSAEKNFDRKKLEDLQKRLEYVRSEMKSRGIE